MQFSVRMEFYGKCMTSIFPYMEIVWLVFLVIPGKVSEQKLAHQLNKLTSNKHLQLAFALSFIMYASLETDYDYLDNFWEISSNGKRLIRVGAKTFAQTGTYVAIKLYKKVEKGNSHLSTIDNFVNWCSRA